MHVLALSGWAQYAKSLECIVPEDATLFNYSKIPSVETVFQALSKLPPEPDVMVGWSLGGQLCCRAIAAGIVKPKRLVLIGAPFQLVSDSEFKGGVMKLMTSTMRLTLQATPDIMLREFQGPMLAQGDSNGKAIKERSPQYLAPMSENEWLFWFDELVHFSCRTLDFSDFPPTDIIHGTNDGVIPFASAEAFAARIPNATLHTIENCGHAPHWHDEDLVKKIVMGEA